MGKSRAAKNRNNMRNNKKRKLGLKPKKKQKQQQPPVPSSKPVEDHDDPVLFGSDEGPSASITNPDQIHTLLEPYTKDQLIGFILDAVDGDAALVANIRAMADRDVSHRKVFVHGLGWDSTRETLLQVFEPYGPVEDCNVIVDKATGRAKGYGFVLFRTRAGAVKALKQPQKMIKNRMAHCQLASVGPVPSSSGADTYGRKVYISNVHANAAPDKLKAFFSQFGEIEMGPFGFDMLTGKSRGYAIFIYKTQEGARRALEEPHKMFDGHQLHCQLANEHGQKGKTPTFPSNPTAAATIMGATPQPVLAAVAAAQNLALYNQNPAAYSALLGQNPLLAAAALNPIAAAALNPAAGLLASQGQVLGGGLGIGGGSSLLGAYGSQTLADLQGLQSYQGSQFGQSSTMKPSGSYGGFP
ncbi:hypothetical protein Cni_G02000 [Canna indica]|uniref:RRM domain-containing protein n=1 Tax=Canna indica TaxID=4628 RepID=A0AAQ3JNL3_9LILI|nr:hypothetical protein Cni_G02000 [Canna indica]